MSRFRFRLARLMRVREVQSEIARMQWREAVAAARAVDDAARGMRQSRAESGERLGEDLHSGAIGPAAMIPGHEALDGMDRAAGRLERHARTLEHQAEELRRPFQERRQDVRGLERLRERRLREHRQEEMRKEFAQMDEVATARARRRAAEPDARNASERRPDAEPPIAS